MLPLPTRIFQLIGFWQKQLDAGYPITAIGGSDNHDPDRPVDEAGSIGQPVTAVFAQGLDQESILGAIRRGQVLIDLDPIRQRTLDFRAERGDQVVAFDSPLGRIGIAICYDQRVPELFRAMAQLPNPVDLLVLPAAYTETTGRAHWELLLRARAVENQCFVLAAAQGGQHPNGRMTHGNSMVIDPWGEVLARMDKGEGVVIGELNRQKLVDTRTSLPALKHRIL